MIKLSNSSLKDLGDSLWWRYMLYNIHQFDVEFTDTASCVVYEPNISPIIGNKGIELVKDASVVDLLPRGKQLIISTVQEPICREGDYFYHENVNVGELLYNACLTNNINPNDVCYASGDFFINDVLNKNSVKQFFVPGWNHLFWGEREINIDLTDRLCTNLFLSFNRIHKPHRMYFINRLQELKLLDNNLVSCADIIDGETFIKHIEWIVEDKKRYGLTFDSHNLIDIDVIRKTAAKVQSKLPLVLDVSDFQKEGCFDTHTLHSSIPFYQNSFMSVITESNAVGPGCYISEAIFRPFIFMQPFLVIGQPRTLEVLREWGFDVFDDIFDNSYDNEPDQFKRIEMVLSEIIRMKTKTVDELYELTQLLKDRLIRNKDRYYSDEFKSITKGYFTNITNWIISDV